MCSFTIGCDPEIVTRLNGKFVNAHNYYKSNSSFGLDGCKSIAELRPGFSESPIDLTSKIYQIIEYVICPYCNSDKLGKISRGRFKCYKCKKEWHKRKGSILEAKHINSNIFLAIIKLFSDSTGVTAIAFELNLDVKTVTDFYDDLAGAILKEYSLEASTFANSVFYLTQQKNAEIRVLENADQINIGKETFGKFKILRNRNLDLSYSFSYKFVWVQSNRQKN
jgi:transposase-like protein